MKTGLDSADSILEDELYSFVISFPSIDSPILANFDFNIFLLMCFWLSHLLNLRTGIPPNLLANDFASFADFTSMGMHFLMFFSAI